MKKTIFGIIVLSLIFIPSCKKNPGNPGGSWTFKSNTYSTTTCQNPGAGILSATNLTNSNAATYGTLIFDFFGALPTTGGTYTVVYNRSLTSKQVHIEASTGGAYGSIIYNDYYAADSTNKTVSVTVSNGKVSVSGSGIMLHNYNNFSDSSVINFNVTQL